MCYKTNLIEFKKFFQSQLNNFSNCIIVNNSPEISFDSFQSLKVTIINNPSNIGLSAAINVGVNKAKNLGFNMVALFDQDTYLSRNFTQQMMHFINQYQCDKPVAVYSPIFHNHVIDETSKHINFKPFRLIRGQVDADDYAYPHYVITSGSFIPISVLDDVGLMRENYLSTSWTSSGVYELEQKVTMS